MVDNATRQLTSVDDSRTWDRRFATKVALCDIAVIIGVSGLAFAVGVGDLRIDHWPHQVSAMTTIVLLIICLVGVRAWEPKVLGQGSVEFGRLGRAVSASLVTLALIGLLFKVESVRFCVFGLIPTIGLLCLVSRYLWRKWLHRQRYRGRYLWPVLAVGTEEQVDQLAHTTQRAREFGWNVTAACTPRGTGEDTAALGVPVLGDLDEASTIARHGRFRVVAVCSPGWDATRLRTFAWELEDTDVELVVHPGLMEIGSTRLQVTLLDGMPLLRLSHPQFRGTARVVKAVLDRCAALVLTLVLMPVLLLIALLVRLDAPGPALFRQERVGLNGQIFVMYKFRTMCVDAERQRAALATVNEGAWPLFKMAADPRVTRIGRVLRRYSLDELPQLINVLTGSMSIVGPRPPLAMEVSEYGVDAQRRLLVRPGMTGLWQVSGRSTLPWEEAVRLDIRYVENWSLAMDLLIVWKTVGAVLRGEGAF